MKVGMKKVALLSFIAAAMSGISGVDATPNNSPNPYGGGFHGNREYVPSKHTKQTYRSQQREAKKRRKARQ